MCKARRYYNACISRWTATRGGAIKPWGDTISLEPLTVHPAFGKFQLLSSSRALDRCFASTTQSQWVVDLASHCFRDLFNMNHHRNTHYVLARGRALTSNHPQSTHCVISFRWLATSYKFAVQGSFSRNSLCDKHISLRGYPDSLVIQVVILRALFSGTLPVMRNQTRPVITDYVVQSINPYVSNYHIVCISRFNEHPFPPYYHCISW